MDQRQHSYLWRAEQLQKQLHTMWQDKRVQLYNDENLPGDIEEVPSVFLAGPTSRNQILECNWRCEAVRMLREAGFIGWIFCPEPRGQELANDFTERSYIHTWESSRLMCANHVTFWIPRKADELLGLNTNLELGIFLGMLIAHNELRKTPFDKPKGRFVRQIVHVGWPSQAERMGLPKHYVEIAGLNYHTELLSLCKAIASASRVISKST